jgi:ribosomal protein S18 acetylase RimI-like enzyme
MKPQEDWRVELSQDAILRLLHKEDIAAVAKAAGRAFGSDSMSGEIREQLALYCDAGLDRTPLERQRDGMPREYYALSTNEGAIIGVAGLYRFGHWTWDGILWLGWFAVDPDYQRQGLGAAALDALERLAQEKGARIVKVEALASGEAVGFYLRHGFEREAVLRSHYGPDLDAVVLSKRLDSVE